MVKMLQMLTLRNNQEHCIVFILICIINSFYLCLFMWAYLSYVTDSCSVGKSCLRFVVWSLLWRWLLFNCRQTIPGSGCLGNPLIYLLSGYMSIGLCYALTGSHLRRSPESWERFLGLFSVFYSRSMWGNLTEIMWSSVATLLPVWTQLKWRVVFQRNDYPLFRIISSPYFRSEFKAFNEDQSACRDAGLDHFLSMFIFF